MSVADEIRKLAELRDAGHVTEDEFLAAKKRLLEPAGLPVFQGDNVFTRLRRSSNDRWIGGVCGGLAKVTGMESWVWRLLFVLTTFFAGFGILPYLLLWIFVPPDDQP